MAKKSKVVRVGDLTWTPAAWEQMLADADRASAEYARRWPRVTAVRYDRTTKLVVLDLSNGAQLAVPADKLQGVAAASEAARSDVRILGPNWAIEFPKIDEQFTVEGLLTGVFGTAKWLARQSKSEARAKSPEKTAAVRANGHKETRPKKFITA